MNGVLRPGLWLGTGNRIAALGYTGSEWVAVDTTTAAYRQSDHPAGLQATEDVEPDVDARPVVPWPEPPAWALS